MPALLPLPSLICQRCCVVLAPPPSMSRTPPAARVLLLNMGDESASGANLTTASHAFFVHPVLKPTAQEYTACETQAIGRIRRYGQTKTVRPGAAQRTTAQ